MSEKCHRIPLVIRRLDVRSNRTFALFVRAGPVPESLIASGEHSNRAGSQSIVKMTLMATISTESPAFKLFELCSARQYTPRHVPSPHTLLRFKRDVKIRRHVG